MNNLKKINEYRSNKRKETSPFFYKVSNHHELFKIGLSFYNDYKNGVKNFAIASTGYQLSQQRTILGLASFFDHEEKLRIGIISDNLFNGGFKEIVSVSEQSSIELNSIDIPISVHRFYEHFDFIDLNILTSLTAKKNIDYFEVLNEMALFYDVIFWDVPELQKVLPRKESYFPIIMKFESLSIVVAQKSTCKHDIEEVRNFFNGYGINLKGFLMDSFNEEEKNDNVIRPKAWWRGIFK